MKAFICNTVERKETQFVEEGGYDVRFCFVFGLLKLKKSIFYRMILGNVVFVRNKKK